MTLPNTLVNNSVLNYARAQVYTRSVTIFEGSRRWRTIGVAILVFLSGSATAQTPEVHAVARNLVQAGIIKAGDKVFITGSVRDATLLEHIAIETRKSGGEPLIVFRSEELMRRSYDEVPAMYDTLTPKLLLAIFNTIDVEIAIDVGETEGLLAGIPQERRAARAKAIEQAFQAFYRRNVRLVNLGNGLYPTETRAKQFGITQPELASAFWESASVPPKTLRMKGEALRGIFANGKHVKLTHPNGTNLSFGVDVGRAVISDGAITPEKLKQGGAAAFTTLPAGELILPAAVGSAEGIVSIDRMLWEGEEIRDLKLTYKKGRLTSMTAASNIKELKARYDAAGGEKDQFGFIDIGLNPKIGLPPGTGRIVWISPGGVTVGLGDNRGSGGTNASDFSLDTQLGGATVKVDGKVVVENGVLK